MGGMEAVVLSPYLNAIAELRRKHGERTVEKFMHFDDLVGRTVHL